MEETIEGPPEYQRLDWDQMNAALKHVPPDRGRPPQMPQYLALRGTIARVEVQHDSQYNVDWVNVFFREAWEPPANPGTKSYGGFAFCTSNPQILAETFGPDYRTRMIGKVVELQGEYQRSYCSSSLGSIRVTLAHQLHKVSAAATEASAAEPK